ncbi:MAG: cysteine hydrolase [Actinomycetota bacterium]|nr:cysteine hydrolase [Actinomycetota bacterium]
MTEAAPRKTALVVIDVQNAVMDGAWQGDDVVGRIATLIARAKEAGAPVVYVQHEEDGDMARGSEGWRIVDAIAPGDDDVVVAKRFPDSFSQTTLRETLDGLGVGHLVIAGAQTDACIRTTTLRTLAEGFDLTLVEDAHTTEDATFDMTDGEKVPISAKQIVAHTNLCIWNLTYPGLTSTIAPHDQVEFVA